VVDIMAGTPAMVEVIFAIVVMVGGSRRFSCSMKLIDVVEGRWMRVTKLSCVKEVVFELVNYSMNL